MTRPGFAKHLPPSTINISEVTFPRTKQAPEHNRGHAERPDQIDAMQSKYGPRLQHLQYDLEYDPKNVLISSTYFIEYEKAVYSSGFGPLLVVYCNYCWNNWPIIGIMAMDKLTMQRFVRGQCCPYCEKKDDRMNINEKLMRYGPSHFFVGQAQKLGLNTDRFPYLGVDHEPVRFQELWSVNSPCHSYARELWDVVRPTVRELNPSI